jgi:NADH dehydrogenase
VDIDNQQTEGSTMKEILILGAGYSGMAATMGLAGRLRGREDVHITLVNPQTRCTERLRLHQTASGEDLADLQIPDQPAHSGVEFVRDWVTAIDANAQTVRIGDGYELAYDTLVYALGSVADTATIPGVDEFAHTLNSAQDAAVLADELDRMNEGTVVVAGGGLTGIESAAEIAERHLALDVVLLSNQVPGSMMGEKARKRLHAGLSGLGVQIRTGAQIVKAMSDGVALADGDVVPARAVLWTTGVRVSPMAAARYVRRCAGASAWGMSPGGSPVRSTVPTEASKSVIWQLKSSKSTQARASC